MKTERGPLLWVKLWRIVLMWRCMKGRVTSIGVPVLLHNTNGNGFITLKYIKH